MNTDKLLLQLEKWRQRRDVERIFKLSNVVLAKTVAQTYLYRSRYVDTPLFHLSELSNDELTKIMNDQERIMIFDFIENKIVLVNYANRFLDEIINISTICSSPLHTIDQPDMIFFE